jgi:2-oxoisovalerate ferredoxin oxidoreductase beta subunit
MKARKAVRKALQNQIEGRGFSLIEVLSPCPTGWGLTPTESCDWVRDNLMKAFPLGVLKDESAAREGWTRYRDEVPAVRIPEILGLGNPSGQAAEALTPPVVATARNRGSNRLLRRSGLVVPRPLARRSRHSQGYHVSWLPSYGPEMRRHRQLHVNISTEPIGSPLVSDPTVLIAMNRPSLDKFQTGIGQRRAADLRLFAD